MDKFVLSANLVNALQGYLGTRPFNEVANLALALQAQVAAQMPENNSTPVEAPEEVQ